MAKPLVELTGFEPVTPSLRTRCSAELSYSPRDGRVILEAADLIGPDRRNQLAMTLI